LETLREHGTNHGFTEMGGKSGRGKRQSSSSTDSAPVYICSCGRRWPTNRERMRAAAIVASESGVDLFLGAPNYGLPR